MADAARNANRLSISVLPPPLLGRPFSQPAMETTAIGGDVARPTPMSSHGPTPDNPASSRVTRKRAASINIDEANRHPRTQDLHLSTPASARPFAPDGLQDSICLCTKEIRIPRPRNAFILYRQAFQKQFQENNPKLPNPDISVHLGRQWRGEPDEVKNRWRRLADQDKANHQEQYPGYKYQPRRGGKGASGKPASTTGGNPGRCPKCGGRYISNPRTPSTPLGAAMPVASNTNISSFINPHPRVIEMDHRRHGSTASVASMDAHGRRYTQPLLQNIDEEYGPASPHAQPDPKRMRLHSPSRHMFGSPPVEYVQPHQSDPRYHQRPSVSEPPISAHVFGPGALPKPGNQYRGSVASGANMQPPPRSSISYQSIPVASHVESSFDESLRLPPLQTQFADSLSVSSETCTEPTATAAPNMAQSTGLGVMSASTPVARQQTRPQWQFLLKLDMLRAISPPLQPPSPGIAPYEIRGPIIAIEGSSAATLKGISGVVEKALSISGECSVKVWSDDNQSASPGSESDGRASPLAGYIANMLDWHRKSEALIRYVTHYPVLSATGTMSPSDASIAADKDTPIPDASGPNTSTYQAYSPDPISPRHKLPVAVLGTGYSLTVSDRYAAALPITDTYRNEDHWRWVATLWRGIVGPDLTIYVKWAGEEEIQGTNCVEFINANIVVVRLTEGRGPNGGPVPVVDEKLERRLGFEIMEWVRSGSFGGGMKA